MVIRLTPFKFILSICLIFMLIGTIAYIPNVKSTSSSEVKGIKLPIIMYHHISTSQKRLNAYVITPEQFEDDLIYIKQKGYTTITMTQLINHQLKGEKLPEKPIIISFDDGYESTYAYAFPLLKKYDMCAVVSVVGSYADRYTEFEDHHLGYSHMNWSQIKEMSQTKYVEIQNHTYDMHKQSGERIATKRKYGESEEEYSIALKEDIGKMQESIYNNTGFMPNTFTYPFGSNSDLSKKIIKEMGFSAALICESRVNIINENTDLMRLGRFNRPYGKSSEQYFKNILE